MSPNPPSYDLVVIGSGPGGYVAAVRASQLGLRTAIVEKDAKVPNVGLGGSCLHRGCIPTKAMLKSASLYDEAKNHAADFGVRAAGVELDFPGVVKFRDKVVFRGAKGVEYLMKKHKVDVHAGLGRLVSPHEVAVKGDAGETKLDDEERPHRDGLRSPRPAVSQGGRRERPELGPHPEVAVDPEVPPRDRLGGRRR